MKRTFLMMTLGLIALKSFSQDRHQAYATNATTGVQSFTGELGMPFKVNNPIIVNALGAFDDKNNGITGTQSGGVRVAIFNKATKQIVPGLDAIIAGQGDGYNIGYRFKSVNPVTLTTGDYVVVAKGYSQNELNGNSGMGSPAPYGDLGNGAISWVSGSLYGAASTSGFGYPNNGDGSKTYLAGTFMYSAVAQAPIPSSTKRTIQDTLSDIITANKLLVSKADSLDNRIKKIERQYLNFGSAFDIKQQADTIVVNLKSIK